MLLEMLPMMSNKYSSCFMKKWIMLDFDVWTIIKSTLL